MDSNQRGARMDVSHHQGNSAFISGGVPSRELSLKPVNLELTPARGEFRSRHFSYGGTHKTIITSTSLIFRERGRQTSVDARDRRDETFTLNFAS